MIPRCLMCASVVTEKGATCSLDCYLHFYQYLSAAGPYIPVWMPTPLPMEENEWWHREQERIKAYADEHELN